MAIRGAYAFYKEIRLEVIMAGKDSEIVEPAAEFRVRKTRSAAPAMLGPNSRKGDLQMREWHKPTIEETESGMEVTSYLPAELDRA